MNRKRKYCGQARLWALLVPGRCLENVLQVPLHELWGQGVRGIIFDLDNTLVPWDRDAAPAEVAQWLCAARETGWRMAMVSNNRAERVRFFAGQWQMHWISRAYKPASRGFFEAAARMGLKPEQVAVVGDQLLTDVLGGNRAGMHTLWIRPLPAKVMAGTWLIRRVERWLVRNLKERGFWHE